MTSSHWGIPHYVLIMAVCWWPPGSNVWLMKSTLPGESHGSRADHVYLPFTQFRVSFVYVWRICVSSPDSILRFLLIESPCVIHQLRTDQVYLQEARQMKRCGILIARKWNAQCYSTVQHTVFHIKHLYYLSTSLEINFHMSCSLQQDHHWPIRFPVHEPPEETFFHLPATNQYEVRWNVSQALKC